MRQVIPLLSDAAAVNRCERKQTVPGGDQVIPIGRVHGTRTGSSKPMTWYRGGLPSFGERAA
ncbi:flavin reductase [Streptomyces axinellae]|uniref:flavin reductase n=1 Tax=Streptomyces axinellae TaxID=552788 RepID=UPI003CD05B62